MKTAEEVLSGKPKNQRTLGSLPWYHHNIVVKAMKEYASQFTPSPKEISEEEIENQITNVLFGIHHDFMHDQQNLERHRQLIRSLLSLPSSGSKTEEDYWKRRCELAEDCLSKSPCDPDITPEQIEANKKYQLFLKDKQK